MQAIAHRGEILWLVHVVPLPLTWCPSHSGGQQWTGRPGAGACPPTPIVCMWGPRTRVMVMTLGGYQVGPNKMTQGTHDRDKIHITHNCIRHMA